METMGHGRDSQTRESAFQTALVSSSRASGRRCPWSRHWISNIQIKRKR